MSYSFVSFIFDLSISEEGGICENDHDQDRRDLDEH